MIFIAKLSAPKVITSSCRITRAALCPNRTVLKTGAVGAAQIDGGKKHRDGAAS